MSEEAMSSAEGDCFQPSVDCQVKLLLPLESLHQLARRYRYTDTVERDLASSHSSVYSRRQATSLV